MHVVFEQLSVCLGFNETRHGVPGIRIKHLPQPDFRDFADHKGGSLRFRWALNNYDAPAPLQAMGTTPTYYPYAKAPVV